MESASGGCLCGIVDDLCLVFPFHEAEQVLNEFRKQFIAITDAGPIVMELQHEDIISRGDVSMIRRTADPTEQNQILHSCLKEKCTKKAFRTVCKLLTEMQGNPKMRALGEDMRQRLETGVCVRVHVWVYGWNRAILACFLFPLPIKSLFAGHTTSPTALGLKPHMDIYHTATSECAQNSCTSRAMAVKCIQYYTTILQS